jgi:hypothetical protein
MCSVLLLRHFDARKPSSVAQVRRQSGERAAKLRCFGSLILPALAALVVLAGGAMAQGQEVSAPILSSGMRGTAPVQTQAFGNLSQRPAAEHLFDAQNMPPIDSIGATSDIRPFLASGVPEDLTRAALRRAWSADPAIRDFIGLSENSWDSNASSSLTWESTPRPMLEETESADSDRLAAEGLTHDQVPVMAGETLQTTSPAQGR